MNIHADFEELLRFLEKLEVEYMVVGGYAVAFHGYPRFTKDIDVFFRASEENAEQLRQALIQFGFPEEQLTREVFLTEGNILTFGVEPVRIDMMNEIDGVSYDEAAPNVVRGKYGDVEVPFIGLDALVKNKRATRRLKDKVDAEELTRPDALP